MKQRVLVVCALESEKIDIADNTVEVHYCLSGVGKVSSAINLQKAITDFKPHWVLNIGTAGSINYLVGDLLVCNRFIDRDMERAKSFGAISELSFENELSEFIKLNPLTSCYTCNTGDTFLIKYSGEGDVFDMEAFALASVCKANQLPFLAVKYVTDIIGQNSVAHWEEKLVDAQIALHKWGNGLVFKPIAEMHDEVALSFIKSLKLKKHPEGGWYKETYRSSLIVCCEGLPKQFTTDKHALTSILFLLQGDEKSVFHRLKSPEVWYFHKGDPILLYVLKPNGSSDIIELSDLLSGKLQVVVEPDCWFAASLKEAKGFGLVGCSVAPGFDFEDMEYGNKSYLLENYSHMSDIINKIQA